MVSDILILQSLKEAAKQLNALTSDVYELIQVIKEAEAELKGTKTAEKLKTIEAKLLKTSGKLAKLTLEIYELGTEKKCQG